MKRYRILMLWLMLACTGTMSALAQDTVVVEIGNESITMTGVTLLMLEDDPTLLARVLDKYVADKIIVNQAKKEGLQVTEEEIQKYINENINTKGDDRYKKFLEIFPEKVLRDYITDTILRNKRVEQERQKIVQEHKITVTDAEVSQHYVKNIKKYTRPPQVRFQYILLQDAKKVAEVEKALKESPDFEELAQKYSEDRDSVGRVNFDTGPPRPRFLLERDGFPAALLDEVFKMTPGEGVKKVKVGEITIFIKLIQLIPLYEPPLGEVKELIRKELEAQEIEPYIQEWFRNIMNQTPVEFKVSLIRDYLQPPGEEETKSGG